MPKAKKSFVVHGERGSKQWYNPGDEVPEDVVGKLSNPDALLESEEAFTEFRDMPYEEWTVAALKDELTSRGLPVRGAKHDLVDRLRDNDEVAE